jgi:hypothetical protein
MINTAADFWWDYEKWYYVYGWSPVSGWDIGRWVLGRDLCSTVANVAATWFVVFNWPANKAVVFDTASNMQMASCLHFSQLAPPGTVIA